MKTLISFQKNATRQSRRSVAGAAVTRSADSPRFDGHRERRRLRCHHQLIENGRARILQRGNYPGKFLISRI